MLRPFGSRARLGLGTGAERYACVEYVGNCSLKSKVSKSSSALQGKGLDLCSAGPIVHTFLAR